jgi:hypothetical protein
LRQVAIHGTERVRVEKPCHHPSIGRLHVDVRELHGELDGRRDAPRGDPRLDTTPATAVRA